MDAVLSTEGEFIQTAWAGVFERVRPWLREPTTKDAEVGVGIGPLEGPDQQRPIILFRRPELGDGERTVQHGIDRSRHRSGDASAWLTDDEEYIQEYFVRGDGYVRFEMHPSFEEELGQYRRGDGSILSIPWQHINRFNELTLRRAWIPHLRS